MVFSYSIPKWKEGESTARRKVQELVGVLTNGLCASAESQRQLTAAQRLKVAEGNGTHPCTHRNTHSHPPRSAIPGASSRVTAQKREFLCLCSSGRRLRRPTSLRHPSASSPRPKILSSRGPETSWDSGPFHYVGVHFQKCLSRCLDVLPKIGLDVFWGLDFLK